MNELKTNSKYVSSKLLTRVPHSKLMNTGVQWARPVCRKRRRWNVAHKSTTTSSPALPEKW